MFWYLCILVLVGNLECYKRGGQIYQDLTGISGCFRALNGTHQIGCSSSLGGDYGVLHFIENAKLIDWLVHNSTNYPYIVLMNPEIFNLENVDKLKESGKVSGVLIIASYDRISLNKFSKGFSPDLPCPNEASSLYSNDSNFGHCKLQWNSVGQGLYFHDLNNFPIFLIRNNDTAHTLMNECYLKFNTDGPNAINSAKSPLCAVQLTFEMYGVKDAVTCRRRSSYDSLSNTDFCDIMGDRNVWSLLKPTNKSLPLSNRSVIILSAKMDALTMFEGISPAVESAITGMVTLLTVANTLSKHRQKMAHKPDDKNIMFLFLNGESYDYIGSSSLIYDMDTLSHFPEQLDIDMRDQLALMNTSHVSHYIEIGQVGLSDNSHFWIHTDPVATKLNPSSNVEVQRLIGLFKNQSTSSITFSKVSMDQPIPPCSLQSFLKADNSIPGIYVADHPKEYNNKFFHSYLDDVRYLDNHYKHLPTNASLTHVIQDLATHVSRVIYNLATNSTEDMETIVANFETVTQLLECYTKNASCSFWKSISDQVSIRPDQTPFPHYVSVKSYTEPYTALTQLSLAYLTSTTDHSLNVKSKEECHALNKNQSILNYYWARGFESVQGNSTPFCYSSITHWSPAISPAFRIDAYDLSLNKGSYSTWTESVWSSQPKLRMFLLPDTDRDFKMLAFGLFTTLLTLFIVFFGKRHATTLFNLQEESLPDNGVHNPTISHAATTTS